MTYLSSKEFLLRSNINIILISNYEYNCIRLTFDVVVYDIVQV